MPAALGGHGIRRVRFLAVPLLVGLLDLTNVVGDIGRRAAEAVAGFAPGHADKQVAKDGALGRLELIARSRSPTAPRSPASQSVVGCRSTRSSSSASQRRRRHRLAASSRRQRACLSKYCSGSPIDRSTLASASSRPTYASCSRSSVSSPVDSGRKKPPS